MDLDNVRSLAVGGERIKAIQLLRSLTGCSLERAMAYVDALALGNEPSPIEMKTTISSPLPNSSPPSATENRFEAQIARLSFGSRLLGRKEICELPNILWHDENVLDIVQGTYSNGNGILVSTEGRLVFIDKGLLYGLKVEDFPYDKISSIQYETGMLFGKITIFTSGNKAVIANVEKGVARTFAEGVRARISAPKPVNTPPASAEPAPSLDIAGQLERLASLKQQGFLTDEEFSHQKRKLLGIP